MRSYATVFYRLNQFYLKNVNISSNSLCSVKHFSDWHIVGALCLERKPVVTQKLTPLEEKYSQYLHKLEVEQSYLSEHEKRHLNDLKVAEKVKQGNLEELDTVSKQTAQDFEDASVKDINKYNPASRITEGDQADDRHSPQRKLDSSLVLVVKQKLGNDHRWVLPQTVHEDGETLRQTAERLLHELFPESVKARFMGNAPVGYYKYKYPKAHREDGVCGARVFFFKAQLLEKSFAVPNINVNEQTNDYMWLTHSELPEVLQVDYGKTVQSFLYPDTYDVDSDYLSHSSSSSDEEEPVVKTSASN